MKIDAAGVAAINSTAKGTGHTGLWPTGAGAVVGNAEFLGENEAIVIRQGVNLYALNIAVVQAKPSVVVKGNGAAYGGERNCVQIAGAGALGYLSAMLSFAKQSLNQVLEAENMELEAGTEAVVEAEASGEKAAKATRTAEAVHVASELNWPGALYGTWRVWARVRVTASTLKIFAKTPKTTGAVKTTSSTSYVWVDLGELVTEGGAGRLQIFAWLAAAGTLYVDRIEAFLVEDRFTAHGGIYEGGRDRGQAALIDSRTIPTIVTRSV
jgi:hypothetical protein